MSAKGIQIVVDPKAPLLPILLEYQKLLLRPFLLPCEVLRIIEIPEGEAVGLLWAKFPGTDGFIKTFDDPKNVYIVQDFSGETLVKNWYLCLKCWKLAGEIFQRKANEKIVGSEDVWYKCKECGYVWEVTI